MITNKCNECSEEFGNDTDFKEHLLMHKVMNAEHEYRTLLIGMLSRLAGSVEQALIYSIMKTENVTVEEAVKFRDDMSVRHNKLMSDMYKSISDK